MRFYSLGAHEFTRTARITVWIDLWIGHYRRLQQGQYKARVRDAQTSLGFEKPEPLSNP